MKDKNRETEYRYFDTDETGKYQFYYSAREQEEIRKIRAKYLPPEQGSPEQLRADKLSQLRRLDESVGKAGIRVSLPVGILSTLLLGLGMSCSLAWAGSLFIPGIVIGLIGIAGMCLTPLLYQRVTQKHREKIAPEILRLTEELGEDK